MLKLKTDNPRSGFTIVELLIVIVVIGILAAITIVAYNNVNDKARASSAISALDQAKKKLELYRVENGGYPADLETIGIANTTSLTYGYSATDTNANFCLTATVGEISYYLNNSTKTSPTEGGCNGHDWPGGVVMTNLVTNGDFSQGVSGWSKHTSYGLSVSDGVMSQTIVTAGTPGGDYMSNSGAAVILGNQYYVSIEINPFRTHTPRIYIGHQYAYASASNAGTFSKVSVIVTANGTGKLHLYSNSGSPTGAIVGATTKYKNISAIDLTATFGAGNEPTKAQMDQIMQQFPNSWFDGTVTANTRGIL
ncbi:prepilin-type N-terminal cleavage/methylation domain-containing protein [Candidatus Saccharibacteria bacterium]|nr:prepilin-type N-terminal cleavage/methylation domain-containing protein [Candidatus Saccharibacteria bacterium]